MSVPEPPWTRFPGYPPGDPFWRQSGEAWRAHVWDPFWKALSPGEKRAFLEEHAAPEEWRNFYEPGGIADWLAQADEDAS